ncbi:hypothetical protein BRADI_1g49663v3 [Brachypodium distachyon]|uniref:Uncharacterized protein n=1 Tax=Brachypodium distachyon TaxID=15368 RepID=A0A0Q3H9I0_BRADI|nr:hypothetical protein BRADI_1g49663v3 [Brachypodium distachyon]
MSTICFLARMPPSYRQFSALPEPCQLETVNILLGVHSHKGCNISSGRHQYGDIYTVIFRSISVSSLHTHCNPLITINCIALHARAIGYRIF